MTYGAVKCLIRNTGFPSRMSFLCFVFVTMNAESYGKFVLSAVIIVKYSAVPYTSYYSCGCFDIYPKLCDPKFIFRCKLH